MSRLFLAIFFAMPFLGETPQNAAHSDSVIQQAVTSIVRDSLDPTPRKPAPQNRPPSKLETQTCSIALVEAIIPKDIRFAITQVAPSKNFRSNMPNAKHLPVCPASDPIETK